MDRGGYSMNWLFWVFGGVFILIVAFAVLVAARLRKGLRDEKTGGGGVAMHMENHGAIPLDDPGMHGSGTGGPGI